MEGAAGEQATGHVGGANESAGEAQMTCLSRLERVEPAEREAAARAGGEAGERGTRTGRGRHP